MKDESEKMKDLCKQYESLAHDLNELHNDIKEYYRPIVKRMCEEKDTDGLDRLVSDLPECPFLFEVFKMRMAYKLI